MPKNSCDYEKCYKKLSCHDNSCCVDVCLDAQKVLTSVYNTCIGSVEDPSAPAPGNSYFINGVLITYQIIITNTSNYTINNFQIIDNMPTWLENLNNLCPDANTPSGNITIRDIPSKVKYTLVCNDVLAEGNNITLNPELGGESGTIGTTGCPGLLNSDISLNPCDTVNISAELTIPRLIIRDNVLGDINPNDVFEQINVAPNYLQNVIIVTGNVDKTTDGCGTVRMKPHVITGTQLAPSPDITYKKRI